MPVYTYKKVVSISRNRLVIRCKEKTVSISFADCIHNLQKRWVVKRKASALGMLQN